MLDKRENDENFCLFTIYNIWGAGESEFFSYFNSFRTNEWMDYDSQPYHLFLYPHMHLQTRAFLLVIYFPYSLFTNFSNAGSERSTFSVSMQ